MSFVTALSTTPPIGLTLINTENCTLDVSVILTVRGMVPQVAVISKG